MKDIHLALCRGKPKRFGVIESSVDCHPKRMIGAGNEAMRTNLRYLIGQPAPCLILLRPKQSGDVNGAATMHWSVSVNVIVSGDGFGARSRAFLSNGRWLSDKLTSNGSVILTGGLVMMKFSLSTVLGGLTLTCAIVGNAQVEESVNPGINDSFKAIKDDVTSWVERFEREGREVYLHRQRIIDACEIDAGMTIADIGAGTGLFTTLLAQATAPNGSVFAVDIIPPFIANIAKRMVEAKIDNVTPVLCTDKSTNLPPASVDKVFICDTYHHFEYPKQTLASIHQALRPGGEILLVEFHRIPGKSSDFIMGHVRAGQEVFVKEIEAAGFESMGEVEGFLKDNYLIRFRKKD